jgi:F5/8 type C domain-containing protein
MDTYDGGTDTCTAGCMTASATCPAQSCYVVSAVPNPVAGFDNIANDKLLPQYAVDGNTATRFSDEQAQMGGEYFQIDLCQAKYVNGITVNDTVDTTDVATAFEVNVSLDGHCWTTVFNSQTPAATLEVITFPSVLARFVRYEQTGNDTAEPMAPWFSIDEITVQCGSADGGP